MHWLLIGYMFLFIHRPFEVWPALGDMHVERVYMLATLAAWVLYPGKRWLPNAQHAAYAFFAFAVLVCWLMSPWMERSQPMIEDYFKIVVFYVLLVTTIHDERGLKQVVVAFLAIMAIYLTHSLREFIGGRFTYRMGISRMIGVDGSLGDPNSFGATIVFALPFIPALWKAGVGGRFGQLVLIGYLGLSTLCILLTGSRSSLIGLVVWALLLALTSKRRWLLLALFAIAAPVCFIALPESLQTRFETIINPEVGPANAKESGEGRIQGLMMGFELWASNPLTGIGPGAWRPATHSFIESHNLYGQLLGELGTLGAIGFIAILACFWSNYSRVRAALRERPDWRNDLVFQVAGAVAMGVFLLLFMGNFGHNLFRYSWLWYGGFLIIARHCVDVRLAEWEAGPEEYSTTYDEYEVELPHGWIAHPGHVRG
ncbi:O-antigen ligase family protein [Fimbriiglobus ruber]|uniref:Putative membrane protein of ExoQ family, involved in exopolysaccharide production n=1 Tax=Fimbriiglobus ruber TaxID=1908690 RepID=A0A225DNV4_9BACT|nr:O-antigen ligase family protein [Fimbriiglobus ruber]OWK40258.1 putative membrane protein of ExoQ family, involved in exopolysaccharide production [Fimbriiglobus ruber]